jgi:hypothetical protein
MSHPIFIYVDESGDLDFNRKRCSDHFAMAAMITANPVSTAHRVLALKYDLMQYDMERPYFHATEDSKGVRKRMLDVIDTLPGVGFHAIYADKHKAEPPLWDKARFYNLFAGALAGHFAQTLPESVDPVVLVYDAALPKKDQKQFHKEIKPALRGRTVKIHFDSIKHDPNGQVADYAAWALTRHLDGRDSEPWRRISNQFSVEAFDLFRGGDGTRYW